MNQQVAVATRQQVQAQAPPTLGVGQRTCACGTHSIGGGECAACRTKRAAIERWSGHGEDSAYVESHDRIDSRFSHQFAGVPATRPAPARSDAPLVLGRPHDDYEREADAVAERVMRASISDGILTVPQNRLRSPMAGSPVPTPWASQIRRRRTSGGKPLTPGLRSFMERRLQRDFSGVRVHEDSQAAQYSHALAARAFTVGQHVFFGEGAFRPQTTAGLSLIAHELAHTIQQEGTTADHIQRTPATASVPAEALPTNCFDGLFAPQPSPAVPAFEAGRALATRWVNTAQDLLKKERDGTATPAEASLIRTTFTARFGAESTFAGMKKVDQGAVAQPRVAQTARDVVVELVAAVGQALTRLRPAQFGAGVPEPGEPPGFDLTGRRSEAQRQQVVTGGVSVLCGRTPSEEACGSNTAAFFSGLDNAIAVCDTFFTGDNRARAVILIHELVHALVQPGVTDVYTHSRLFNVLQAAPDTLGRPGGFALRNPDSIAEFIRILAEVTATGAELGPTSTAPTDVFEGFGDNEPDVRTALGFAHQRALLAQRALSELLAGLSILRTVVVGRSAAGESSAMTWGSERDRVVGCYIQRTFEATDSRTAELGDPCGGGDRIGSDGVTFLEDIGRVYGEMYQAFAVPLAVRYQPGAAMGDAVVWVPGAPATVLIDDPFFAMDPPARAEALLLGMRTQSLAIPSGIEGTPPVVAQAGVVTGITPAHVALMSRLLEEVLPGAIGPGG